MKNYYKDILVQIEKHIDMNEDDKALTLIREELSLPYIPMETEKELHKFLELVNSKLISEKPFDIQKIFELINSPKFDGIDKLGTVEMLAKANLREYDVEIKEILHNKNKIVPFVFKVRLLMLLKEQNIDNKYELLNVDNKQITIDLKDVTLPQDNLAFAAESNRVNVLLERHPGVFTVALNLLENFYYAMFPWTEDTDFEGQGEIAAIVAASMLEQQDIVQMIESKVDIKKLKEKMNKITM